MRLSKFHWKPLSESGGVERIAKNYKPSHTHSQNISFRRNLLQCKRRTANSRANTNGSMICSCVCEMFMFPFEIFTRKTLMIAAFSSEVEFPFDLNSVAMLRMWISVEIPHGNNICSPHEISVYIHFNVTQFASIDSVARQSNINHTISGSIPMNLWVKLVIVRISSKPNND